MRKYGLENFSLAIIEFCTPDLASCLELEQKWIDYYQPKYNILKEARSSIGFRHSKETISKLKDMFSKRITLNEEVLVQQKQDRLFLMGLKSTTKLIPIHLRGLKGELSPQYGIGGKQIYIYSESGKELNFPSINGCKNYLKVR